MESILFIGVFVIIMMLVRYFIIIIHEFGHAIPALLFTKDKVVIFIGSYGSTSGSFNIQLKRLLIYVKRNPFKWRGGVCIPSIVSLSLKKNFCIYISGTLLPIFISGMFVFIVFYFNLSDLLKFISFVSIITALVDIPRNLIANSAPIILQDGAVTYNDGQLIADLRKNREAIIQSFITNKNSTLLSSKDYFNSAEIKREEGNFIEAIKDYTSAIDLDPMVWYYYNNRGYTYLDMDLFEKAILDFTKAIALNPNEAFAYNNRGFAKIMLGNLNQGLDDVLKSLELNDDNAYAFRNLGIFHLKRKEIDKALDFFNYTFDIDKKTPLLSEYIAMAKEYTEKDNDRP